MRIFLISDNADTLTGLRLAGIDGVIAHEEDELRQALEQALAEADIGIVLIMERAARLIPEMIRDIRLNRTLPLLVEIPDRHGMGRPADFVSSYIREAIGIKL
ncbi:MAG: V-type ATP synthase subunit F [Peptococcaceae bacterium]|jgi:V/A-type H+-transporting ATPase subunit F|nr:V-type ATP synthase subunit F [Peptococcaceae bacterium]